MADQVAQDEWVSRVLGISVSHSVNGVTPIVSTPPDPGTKGAVAYGKARLTWLATRSRLVSDLDALRAAVRDYYKAEGIADEIERQFNSRVQPKLVALDETLADTLDMVINATDPVKRGELIEAARETIGRYQSFIASDALFRTLDDNPFLSLRTAKVMTETLATLASTVR